MKKRFVSLISLVLLCLFLTGFTSAAAIGSGTVNASGLRIRAEANTDSEILGQLYTGDAVEVLSVLDGWYEIAHDDGSAYVSAQYVDYRAAEVEDAEASEAEEEEETLYGIVTGSVVNVRSGPSTDYSKKGQLKAGANLTILEELDGWYRFSSEDISGYICADYVYTYSESDEIGQQVAALAPEYLGIRYVSGGASPSSGFDCSGFTMYLYKQFGISISRTCKAQASEGIAVDKSELQPGDLVFFCGSGSSAISHVGIYIGDGAIVHARYSTRSISINYLSESYYTRYYVCARRIVE